MSSQTSKRPRRRPVQDRSKETVAVILEGAAQVFAERGYAGTTTNRIARRAGVSVGSIYQYFPNKDAILAHLLERHVESASAVVSDMLGGLELGRAEAGVDAGERLRPIVERVVALHAAEPELHRVLLLEAPRLPDLIERLHRLEEGMTRVVGVALRQAYGISDRDAERAAYLIVHVVELMAHEYVTHPPDDMGVAAFVDELVTMVGAYIEAKRRG